MNAEGDSWVVGSLFLEKRFALLERAVLEYLLDVNRPHRPIITFRYDGNGPGRRLIFAAAEEGAVGLLRALVQKGADPNRCGRDEGALHAALHYKKVEAALVLINDEAPGVDLDEQDAFGNTPLSIAADKGLVPVLKALVAKGADLDALDGDREHPQGMLVHAIRNEQEEAALYLLEAGAPWRPPRLDHCVAEGAARFGQLRLLIAVLRRLLRDENVDAAARTGYLEAAANAAVTDAKHGQQVQALELRAASYTFKEEHGEMTSTLCTRRAWAGTRRRWSA